jgi:hypothetical protein
MVLETGLSLGVEKNKKWTLFVVYKGVGVRTGSATKPLDSSTFEKGTRREAGA